MKTYEFHHFGVPTQDKHEDETYIESARVYITNPETHPFRVEFLRFEADSPMPQEVCAKPHAAFLVDCLEEALAGQTVVIEPFLATENLRCAFIKDGDAIIEVMQRV